MPQSFVEALVSVAGPAGADWIERLPALVAEAGDRWALTIDGPSMHGMAGLVVPVRTGDGGPAVLKISWPHEEAAAEAAGLRGWAGAGAVRLLAEDPDSWSLLLERLDHTRTLEGLADAEAAVATAAGLLGRLHVPSPRGIPTVAGLAARWVDELPREWEACGHPLDRRLVDEAVSTCQSLGPSGPVRLLHGDFHYANILAGRREPWLVIDPKPLAGDPAFDIGPLLRNRWSDLTGTADVTAALRRRFDRIVEAAGLDADRARAWTVVRSVDNVLWATARSDPTLADVERTIAEALSG